MTVQHNLMVCYYGQESVFSEPELHVHVCRILWYEEWSWAAQRVFMDQTYRSNVITADTVRRLENFRPSPSTTKIKPVKYFNPQITKVSLFHQVVITTKM